VIILQHHLFKKNCQIYTQKVKKHWTFGFNVLFLSTAGSAFKFFFAFCSLYKTQGTRRLYMSSRRLKQSFICTPIYIDHRRSDYSKKNIYFMF
jgi:hypothetical protein